MVKYIILDFDMNGIASIFGLGVSKIGLRKSRPQCMVEHLDFRQNSRKLKI
jgi:hypothetical protein